MDIITSYYTCYAKIILLANHGNYASLYFISIWCGGVLRGGWSCAARAPGPLKQTSQKQWCVSTTERSTLHTGFPTSRLLSSATSHKLV